DSKEYITTYTYNNLGKLSSVTEQLSDDPENPQESVIRFFYDDKGNLTGTIDAEGNKTSHEYDTFNRRVKTKRHLKDGTYILTSFSYYPTGKLESVTDAKGNKTRYDYDDEQRLKKVVFPDNTFTEVTYTEIPDEENPDKIYKSVWVKQRNGTTVKNRYDELNRLTFRQVIPAAGVEGP
ncbi:MAG: RHS repeat protein, partial [Deltaproteobacteria bacterium]|nr:RHS repeat protein [Deltaproteobacteria bacterium]